MFLKDVPDQLPAISRSVLGLTPVRSPIDRRSMLSKSYPTNDRFNPRLSMAAGELDASAPADGRHMHGQSSVFHCRNAHRPRTNFRPKWRRRRVRCTGVTHRLHRVPSEILLSPRDGGPEERSRSCPRPPRSVKWPVPSSVSIDDVPPAYGDIVNACGPTPATAAECASNCSLSIGSA